jgi:hypothetical protein
MKNLDTGVAIKIGTELEVNIHSKHFGIGIQLDKKKATDVFNE